MTICYVALIIRHGVRKYATFLMISRALHLAIFEQPVKTFLSILSSDSN